MYNNYIPDKRSGISTPSSNYASTSVPPGPPPSPLAPGGAKMHWVSDEWCPGTITAAMKGLGDSYRHAYSSCHDSTFSYSTHTFGHADESTTGIAVSDMNRDGLADVVTVSAYSYIRIYRGTTHTQAEQLWIYHTRNGQSQLQLTEVRCTAHLPFLLSPLTLLLHLHRILHPSPESPPPSPKPPNWPSLQSLLLPDHHRLSLPLHQTPKEYYYPTIVLGSLQGSSSFNVWTKDAEKRKRKRAFQEMVQRQKHCARMHQIRFLD